MSKRKKHAEEHENLERWLVSYADFITLLFATFVVLYALSQLDLAKFKDLRTSLQQAFSGASIVEGSESTAVMDSNGESIMYNEGANTKDSQVPPILDYMLTKMEEGSFNDAQKELNEMIEKNELEGVDVTIDERGLVINLVDSLFFNSGSAEIKKTAYPTLQKVGDMLKTKFADHSIRVEGHTDNLPIRSQVFPSNWELSAARSSSVIRFMLSNFNFKKARFSALGYADTLPVADNKTPEGRSKNRRIEIVVLRNKLAKSEPKKTKPKDLSNKPEETNKQNEVIKQAGEISEAAKKLMKETGQSVQNVILYKDSYDNESQKLSNELKLREQKTSEQAKQAPNE